MSALTVNGGWLDGNNIRKARKSFQCHYWRGKSAGGYCKAPIVPGNYYVEGELTDAMPTRNGVLVRDKYCPQCAGVEAIATIACVGC
jgi:hypothetical protein